MFDLRYVLVTAPASEPVVLADVRAHLRIDDDDTSNDTLLNLLIQAARRYAESYTGRSLITQTWRAVADGFPGCAIPSVLPVEVQQGAPWGQLTPYPASWRDSIIEIRRGPVASISAITYVDATGTTQTLDPSTYVFDSSDQVQRLAPAFGKAWPAARAQLASVNITFVAGYSNAAAVPATIRNWMFVRIATAYEHREAEEIVPRGTLQPLAYVDQLLDSEKVGWL